jgi:hypothetical protein
MEDSFDTEDLIAWLLLNGENFNEDDPIKSENEQKETITFKFSETLELLKPSYSDANVIGNKLACCTTRLT